MSHTPLFKRCFFLDANILISDILGEKDPRIIKLKEDATFHKIPCYISDSVKYEINRKVTDTSNYLGNYIRETVKITLEDFRRNKRIPLTDPMNSDDVKALEDLFSYCHGTALSRKIILMRPLEEIEEWSIKFIGEKLNRGTPLTIGTFLIELTKKLLETTSLIDDLYDNLVEFEKGHIEVKTIVIPAALSTPLNAIGIHTPDNNHIIAAHMFSFSNGIPVVFVTEDYGIISRRLDIKRQSINIGISDPLYALYHF